MSSRIIADVVLCLWPFICVGFFVKSSSPARAALYCFLGGMLFLPEAHGYDFPGLPFLGKEQLTGIGVLLGAITVASSRLTAVRPGQGVDLIVVGLAAGAMATAFGNRDYVMEAGRLTYWDGLSYSVGDMMRYGIPFLVGRAFFRSRKDMRDLLVFMAVAGLFYSLFCLVEMRLSPQFHAWVYGYRPSAFVFAHRLGGWRPNVFMLNGLSLSLFIFASALALVTLRKARIEVFRNTLLNRFGGTYQTAILVMCRSSATILYGLVAYPIVKWGGSRRTMAAALVLSVLVLGYPTLRTSGLFPTEFLVNAAEMASPERAQSLQFRFTNEDRLLGKALERPVFGWGSSGRNRVYDEWTGRDRTVTDGTWVLRLGTRGLVGWAGIFLLLLVPIWSAARQLKKLGREEDRIQLAGIALMLAVYTADLLPNALFTDLPVFLAGSLMGLSQAIRSGQLRSEPRQRPRRPGQAAPPAQTSRLLAKIAAQRRAR